ncbi:MAG TPA: hypothetical protein VNQ77_12740 [Frankiaceae bacterium]|nr:hypothetical protein [Frankiaceae bacterium]
MSDLALERRCRWVARTYPDAVRAEEVLTTLMESSEGRRAPRLGDVLNVLWHALRVRLGSTAPGTRFGRVGDAASIAVVMLGVMQVSAAAALTYRLYEPAGRENPDVFYDGSHHMTLIFYDRSLTYAAAFATLLGAATAAAACLGRVRLARALTAVTAVTGGALVVLAQEWTVDPTFVSGWAMIAAAISVVFALAVLFTGAVARATTLVPTWWWGMSAILCAVVAMPTIDTGRGPGESGRIGVLLLAYAFQVLLLIVLATPLLRTFPYLWAGLTMLLVPAVPFLVIGMDDHNTPTRPGYVVLMTLLMWPVVVGTLAVVLRIRPRPMAGPPGGGDG